VFNLYIEETGNAVLKYWSFVWLTEESWVGWMTFLFIQTFRFVC